MYPTASTLAFLLITLPVALVAQSATARPADTGRATVLIARAELLQRESELPEKAVLYEEASRLLPREDPRLSSALRQAGLIQYQMRKPARSLQLLEQAAELAAARGVPAEAADTYAAALFIALETNARSTARRFIDRALALTNSPLISEADRLRIRRAISNQARYLEGKSSGPDHSAPELRI